jgi:hypothetical protein
MEKHFLRVLFNCARCVALAAALPISCPEAMAQNVIGSGVTGDDKPARGGSYTGPGDVQSYKFWVSCAFVYDAALATTTTSLCDLVASGNGAAVCTLRGSSSGSVDLTSSYCAGNTPAAACAAAPGGSCLVTKAYDQTGNGNHVAETTLSKMAALTFNAQNSEPCMSFNGANTQDLVSSANIPSQAQPVGATWMAKRTSNFASDQVVLSFMNGSFQGLQTGFPNSANTIKAFMGNNLTASGADSSFHAVSVNANGGSSEFYIDGSMTSGNIGSNSAPSLTEYQVGRDVQANDQPFYGVFCEGGYMTSPNTANFPSLNSNIHSRWSF